MRRWQERRAHEGAVHSGQWHCWARVRPQLHCTRTTCANCGTAVIPTHVQITLAAVLQALLTGVSHSSARRNQAYHCVASCKFVAHCYCQCKEVEQAHPGPIRPKPSRCPASNTDTQYRAGSYRHVPLDMARWRGAGATPCFGTHDRSAALLLTRIWLSDLASCKLRKSFAVKTLTLTSTCCAVHITLQAGQNSQGYSAACHIIGQYSQGMAGLRAR